VIQTSIQKKYTHLKEILKKKDGILVAFSGGVDSTLLLKLASDVLPKDKVLAVMALSELTSEYEQKFAENLQKKLGVNFKTIQSKELEIKEFIQNSKNRCYICKKNRYKKLIDIAKQEGFNYVADGTNIDDHQDFRPGNQAAKELGIISPLSEAGLSKDEIRELSKILNLSNWDKASNSCLATRIPYFNEITSKKLKQIEYAEEYVRSLALSRQIRVRHHGDLACIEVDEELLAKITNNKVRNKLVSYFKTLGFLHVTLNLEGYKMGSMNRLLNNYIRPISF